MSLHVHSRYLHICSHWPNLLPGYLHIFTHRLFLHMHLILRMLFKVTWMALEITFALIYCYGSLLIAEDKSKWNISTLHVEVTFKCNIDD